MCKITIATSVGFGKLCSFIVGELLPIYYLHFHKCCGKLDTELVFLCFESGTLVFVLVRWL